MSLRAFIFPGQGSQHVGMKAELESNYPIVGETFEAASEVLGYDLLDVCHHGPEERLNQTEVTQPAMLAADVATWRVWKSLGGPDPDFMAGHSLGEYSALVAAGALPFEQAVGLVAERGRLMQNAAPDCKGAMAAVLGLDDEVLIEVCERAAEDQVVSCANFNSPGQIVIAGHKAAVDRACALASEAGARKTIPLAVSVPSHCALMQPAADGLALAMESVEINTPRIPVLHNVDMQSRNDGDAIKSALIDQMTQPVHWSETVQKLIADGVESFAECGPGKVLTGLNRRIARRTPCAALVTVADIEQTLDDWS